VHRDRCRRRRSSNWRALGLWKRHTI
jgi:hypothetical protein